MALSTSLLSRCINKVACLIDSDNVAFQARSVPATVPTELCERLVERLAASNQLSDGSLARVLAPRMTILRMNNLSGSSSLSPLAIHSAIEACPELEILECAGNRLFDSTIDLLCSQPICDSLRVLNLSSCDLNASQAQRIVQSCRYLRVLDLSNNDKIDGSFVFNRVSDAPVRVSSASHIISETINRRKRKRAVSGSTTPAPSDPSPCNCDCFLQSPGSHQHSSECPIVPSVPTKRRATTAAVAAAVSPPTDVSMQCSDPSVIQKQFHLHKLNISGCSQLVCDAAIRGISSSFPMLSELDISHCHRVTDLSPLQENCALLSHLNISGTSVSFAKSRLAPPPQNLEEFRFSGSGCVDSFFPAFIQHCIPKLRVLELRNKVFEDPAALSQLLPNATQLRSLDLYGTDVDGSVLRAIFDNRHTRLSLEILNLAQCVELSTADWMDAMAPLQSGNVNLPYLSSLALSGIKDRLPVEIVALLGRSCPGVKSLSLGHVSDESTLRQPEVAQMLAAFPMLRSVEVWTCESVSITLLSMIPQMLCRRIEEVQVCSLQARAERRRGHHDDEGDDHVHLNVAPRLPSLALHQISRLQKSFPDVHFKIWQHSVLGERFFQEINANKCRSNVLKLSNIRFEVSRIEEPLLADDLDETHDGNSALLAEAYLRVSPVIDGAYIWTNENSISLDILKQTIPSRGTTHCGGTVPLVRDWCCECNMDDFAGVSFRVDSQHVHWHIREPGPEMFLRFGRDQYIAAATQAQQQLETHLAQIRSERAAARLQ